MSQTGKSVLEFTRQLWRDPIVRVFVVVEFLALTPYFLPWTTAGGMEIYGDLYATLPVKLMAISALLYRPRRTLEPAERRFWVYLAGAYAVWVIAEILAFSLPTRWIQDPRSDLFEDFLFVCFYLLVALALELKPHVAADREASRRLQALRSTGAILFGAALLVYFAVIPRDLTQPEFGYLFPSLFLYILMDVYILIRLAAIRHACDDPSWRRVYGFLLVSVGLWATLDSVEASMYSGLLPWLPMGTLWDLPWHLSYWAILLTARVREFPSPIRKTEPRSPSEYECPWGGPLILYAIAFPLIHFAVNAIGISDPETRTLREIFVVVIVLILSAVALYHQQELQSEKLRLESINRSVNEQLQVSQRMEAVGRLAGGIAHDFNNVLQVVQACSELVSNSLEKKAPQKQELALIDTAVGRASSLTDQLLTVSRRKKHDPRPMDLNQVVNEVATMLLRMIGEDIVLQVNTEPGLPRIYADTGEIAQVIMNLAVNARDAMPDGGTLEIRTALGQDGYSTLIVKDSGKGMSDETRSHIFEPFFTTKGGDRGTGLGLSMVYGIVLRAGGRIDVDSEEDVGTTFTIMFTSSPMMVDDGRQDPVTLAEERGGSESILVVEDDTSVRSSVTRVLEGLGYEVVSSSGGDEALRLLEDRGRPFDLLLTDVVMQGRQGPELARAVLRRYPSTRLLMMSGFVGDSWEGSEVDGTTVTLLRKPFNRGKLAAEVRRILDTQ